MDKYGLRAGRVVTIDGVPVFCVKWIPSTSNWPSLPHELDALARRIVDLLNEDDRAEKLIDRVMMELGS
jgi:hypothetical protein